MCRTCFERFIRSGGTKTFTLRLAASPDLEVKQETPAPEDAVRLWLDGVWSQSFGATTQAILKTKPFEFSPAGLVDLDMDALRADALRDLLDAIEREGIDLASREGQLRALAILAGHLNQVQQAAMGIEFYVWRTQRDARVREDHAEREDSVFRWDRPPEGGHPSEDFGCRCYARPLGIEGYWARVSEGVEAFTSDIGRLEGRVDHMYLDSEGNVTVGIGTLLPDAGSAAALPFRFRATGNPASSDEIRAEFDLIDGMVADIGRNAAHFEQFTDLYLPPSEIDRLVTDHVRGDFEPLLRLYPGFGNFPESAQIALWDMIYNLGPAGLARFRLLRQSINDGDWEEAARQSHRIEIGDERNEYVFDLLMDAAQAP